MSLAASGPWGNSGAMSREGEGEVGRDVKLGHWPAPPLLGVPQGSPGGQQEHPVKLTIGGR